MRAAQMHCGHDSGIGLAVHRRRRRGNAFDTGDIGCRHRHMGSGHQRELAARHIAAHRLHGNIAVAEDHARQRFNFDILHGIALDAGEIPDLLLGEPDVMQLLAGHRAHQIFDVRLRQPE